MKDKGFTLIEVIVSIAILGILAATFIPILSNQYISIIKTGKKSEATYLAVEEVEKRIEREEYTEVEEAKSKLNIEFEDMSDITIDVNYIEVKTPESEKLNNKETKIIVGVPK